MKPQLQSTHTQLESSPAPIELGFVLDRSSSMEGLVATTVAAFNALLAEQRKLNTSAGKASLMLFNDTCESVFDGLPLPAVSDLTAATYQPSGSTSLWDGMGAMIEQIGARFDAAAVPSRVLVVTMTDGAENTSRHYSLEQIRQAIEYRQNACGWRFILISPGAAGLAFKLGIPVTNTSRWETDPAKLRELLERVGRSISAYRLGDRHSDLGIDLQKKSAGRENRPARRPEKKGSATHRTSLALDTLTGSHLQARKLDKAPRFG